MKKGTRKCKFCNIWYPPVVSLTYLKKTGRTTVIKIRGDPIYNPRRTCPKCGRRLSKV